LPSSIKKQLGLATDNRRVSEAEQGIAEMVVRVYRNYEESFSGEILFAWNAMVLRGHGDIHEVGR
jgi:hypothetical protein